MKHGHGQETMKVDQSANHKYREQAERISQLVQNSTRHKDVRLMRQFWELRKEVRPDQAGKAV